MFTGVIEGLGIITAIRPMGAGARVSVTSDFPLTGTKLGDSIAVNGVCLTAVGLGGNRFDADVSPESLGVSVLGTLKVGERVNLERALRFSDRIDGHLVAGHVDGVGEITGKTDLSNALIVTISVPETLTRYMIHKGSVAVDGVSLTINRLEAASFEVSIIPHTAKLTTVGLKAPGSRVNIETDLIGKYVERFMTPQVGTVKKDIDMALLARSGFLS